MMELAEAVSHGDEKIVLHLVQERLNAGILPDEIVAECQQGMTLLGDRFETGDAFLPDLLIADLLMKKILAILGPSLSAANEKRRGTIVLGTVRHDIHDIGKNITQMVLQGAGFYTVDLGVDVPPERFVEAIREHQPQVVGMSLLLTTCFASVFETIEAIRAAGLRKDVKLCVGGAAASQLLAEKTGCDFYAKTAVDGLRWIESFS